jgi:hypothetical protein
LKGYEFLTKGTSFPFPVRNLWLPLLKLPLNTGRFVKPSDFPGMIFPDSWNTESNSGILDEQAVSIVVLFT